MMKRTLLTLSIVAGLLSVAPVVQARDHYDHDRHYDDLRSDVRGLWEWYGRLRDEASNHGSRHVREELDGIRYRLKRVSEDVNDGHYRYDRVRGQMDDIRDDLRHVNGELKWHGDEHPHHGFSIQIR